MDLFDQYADATAEGYWTDDSKRAALAIIESLQYELQEHGVEMPATSPWIDTNAKLPEPGQRIVKRWKNGATWAGVYSGSAKESSFDAWIALPP